jgi:hypothetical protein
MIGHWKIGAQLSTSHSSSAALDPSRMAETVRRVSERVELDLLIVGFREAPDVFRLFCGPTRPVSDVFLWYSALSDIDGTEDSDLVVNWRGERSRGWGGWAEKGGEVEETFRFACPNNPAVREKTLRRLRELMSRYAFSGVFLDKIRFPSPANGIDEALSCFCDHCRRVAGAAGLDLDAVLRILAERAVERPSLADGTRIEAHLWPETIASANPILSRFLKFRSDSVARLVAELAEAMRSLGRKVSLDLFSPCLASFVGQEHCRLSRHCDWAKPMTYRIAQGPAGLRLEIPALVEGVARLFNLDEQQAVDWCAHHIQAFDWDLVERTRREAVPLRFIQAEIDAAVRAMHPVPVYFGLELISQPGVIDVTPADVRAMVGAGRAANAAGLVVSWDLMHAPMDGVEALAEAIGGDLSTASGETLTPILPGRGNS